MTMDPSRKAAQERSAAIVRQKEAARAARPTPAPAAAGQPYVTPAVRNAAAQLGVDLAQVQGTGVGGRIKLDDVYAAGPPEAQARRQAAKTAPAADLTPAPASRFSRPTLMREHRSQFVHGMVKIDAFALNPFLDDLKQVDPDDVAAAMAHDRNVPTMFSGGDTPLFTAAGFDPQLVLRLPWAVRHAAAGTDDPAEVAEIFERCGAGTLDSVNEAELLGIHSENGGHAGLRAYLKRLKTWLYARHVVPAPRALTLDDWRGKKTTREEALAEWAGELYARVNGSRQTEARG